MKLKSIIKKLFFLDAHYPRSIITFVILFTLILLWKIPTLKIDAGMRSLVPTSHPIVKNMELVEDLFSGNEIVLIAIESDSLFSFNSLKKFAALQDSLEEIGLMSRVTSIYNQTHIKPDDGGFSIIPLFEDVPDDSSSYAKFIFNLKESNTEGILVSKDYRVMCFVAQIVASLDFDDIEFREKLYKTIKPFEGPEKIHLASSVIVAAESIDNVKKDLLTFTPIAIGLMIFLLLITFKSWTGTFLPLFVVTFSILWTFGLMAWLNISVPIIGGLIPIMLIAIANNYGIHIISHYYEYTILAPDSSRTEILSRTMKRLGMPIFLAGATTVISFMTLATHEISKVREIGLLVSFGIASSFILSLVLIPAILILVPRPSYLNRSDSFTSVNKFLINWGKFFIRFGKEFLVILFFIMIFFTLQISNITVDTVPDNFFPKDSKIRLANDVVNQSFGGSSQLNILIKGDIYDPEVLKSIEDLTNHIKSQNEIVSSSFSIVDVIKKMHFAFNDGISDSLKIPSSREYIEQYMFLYSITGNGDDFNLILDDSDAPTYTQVFIRLKKYQTAKLMTLVDDTEDYIHSHYYDKKPIEPMLVGPAALVGAASKLVITGQIISLIMASVIIFIIMTIVFKSFVGGLLATLPMSLSVIFIFGILGTFGIPLNISTSLLTCVLVGVGVDYSVHFLWHLREHIREGQNLDSSIANTMKVSGKGILFNGISVVVGFSVLMFSVFTPLKAFSILIMASIGFCLIGSLAMLPALVSILNPKFLNK